MISMSVIAFIRRLFARRPRRELTPELSLELIRRLHVSDDECRRYGIHVVEQRPGETTEDFLARVRQEVAR